MRLRRTALPTITAREAADRLRRGELQIVDVREREELAEGSVAGAHHIPLGELEARSGEIGRRSAVAFLCQSGSRSAIATRTAVNAGYDAVNVEGGVLAWAREGLPLAGGPLDAA